MSAIRKIVPIDKGSSEESGSASFSRKLSPPLTSQQLRKVTRILAPSLPKGSLAFFRGPCRPRQYGAWWTIPNRCPKCGHTPPDGMTSALARRRHMFAHAIAEH